MTRFARAKGSKASNEKLPEEASSWNELKGDEQQSTSAVKPARKRRKTQAESVHINGADVHVEYFDGFPVKKCDADRLKKLHKDLVQKGIPQGEVRATLRAERKRAEKVLSRQKKKVCFNCRQNGHFLFECPALQQGAPDGGGGGATGIGICFKCGSTEHGSATCKVIKSAKFKFAQCFVCKEQGHIARQCPTNAGGLFPNGGACHYCGDVNHMKKDCPDLQPKEEDETRIVVKTIDETNIEGLDVKVDTGPKVKAVKRKKVVKM